MAKLIITLLAIVLLLSFALSYAAGDGATATLAGLSNNLKIIPGGPTFKGASDVSAIKAKQQVAGAGKVLDMEDENCERIYGLEDCLARRARAANLETAQSNQ